MAKAMGLGLSEELEVEKHYPRISCYELSGSVSAHILLVSVILVLFIECILKKKYVNH